MTKVHNLTDGTEVEYDLSPIEATKTAYLQHTKSKIDVPVCVGELTVRVGDWAAWLTPPRFENRDIRIRVLEEFPC